MDRIQWKLIRDAVRRAARSLPKDPRLTFSNVLIVNLFLWAVAHDRPMCWACQRSSFNGVFRPRKLPSVSQFTRRVKTSDVHLILQKVHEQISRRRVPTQLSYVDGKPLPVGVASKDPDAKRGHVMGGFAKGYKLHAMMTEDRRIPVFCVRPLNEHESPIAQHMISYMPEFSPQSLMLADQNYDAQDLHKIIHARGGRLLVKPRGHAAHPRSLRQMGAARRDLLHTWEHTPSLCRIIYKQRIHAESILSGLTSYGGGLGPLPAFVRRLPRVTRWVGAKIILYHARHRAQNAHAE